MHSITAFLGPFVVIVGVAASALAPATSIGAQPAAELRSIGFREAVRLAREKSPDLQLARLRAEKSGIDLALIQAERSTQIHAGSGLGGTSGIPQSVQGAVPSIARVTLRQALLDPTRSPRADAARQLKKSADLSSEAAAEESQYRAGILYLDFELASREVERLNGEMRNFIEIEELTAARVDEGLEVPLAFSRARLDTARARERLASANSRSVLLEAELRSILGLGQGIRLKPRLAANDPANLLVEVEAGRAARPVDEHPEIAALEARIRAAGSEVAAARSERLPRLDILGQYSMLARFNNYDEFFRRFQRHNWQAGIGFEFPLFVGRGTAERVARARLRERELSLERDARRAAAGMAELRAAATLNDAQRLAALARQELDFARENLEVLLAQFDEGRIPLDELSRARALESAAWRGLTVSLYSVAKARYAVVYAAGRIRDILGD